MASSATDQIERPAAQPVARAAGALLDRLFAPHGAAAYFRWVGPSPSPEEVEGPERATEAARPADDDGSLASAGEVTFARSGLSAVAEGSLLETAEAAGLSPRNRCRRGICGTCTTPKLSGTVVDARTGEVSAEAGPIRICVSNARGDVVLDI